MNAKKYIKIDDGDHLGWKPSETESYKWLKYSQVFAMSQQLGSSIIKFGLTPSNDSFVGIYAKNRPEWIMTEQACNMFSMVLIPLYDTLGKESMNFILEQTQLKLIVCDDSTKAMQLMGFKGNLEIIIIVDEITQGVRDKAKESNIKLFSFKEVLELGKSNLHDPVVSI